MIMTSSFPTSLDNFTNPTGANRQNEVSVLHSTQHANLNDAVEALEAKVGIDSSANTDSLDYKVAHSQPLDSTLTALAGVSSTGILVATATDTFDTRTIVGLSGITVTNGSGVSGNPILSVFNIRRTEYIPAQRITPRTTAGCASFATVAGASATVADLQSLDFDKDAVETAQFSWHIPRNFYASPGIQAQVLWSHPSTSTNFAVVWNMKVGCYSDGDNISGSALAGASITDTGGSTDRLYITGEIDLGALTSPTFGDMLVFTIGRTATDVGDTLAVDARLHGVRLIYALGTLSES